MQVRSSRFVLRSLGALTLMLSVGCFNPENIEPTGAQDTDEVATTTGESPQTSPSAASTTPDNNDEDDGDQESTGAGTDADTEPETAGSCGDGIVQGGEECDLGELNAADAACTPMCTIAVCGDGFVHAGAEDCDAGGIAANCDVDCTLPLCGDGLMNPLALEQCDGDEGLTNSQCDACVVVCNPGWSRCGGGPAAPCSTQIDSAASCSTCGHSWQVLEIVADQTLTVDETHGAPGSMGVIESALYGTSRMVGWMGFDLANESEPLMVQEARLRLHVVGFDFSPAFNVVADPSPSWPGSSSQSVHTVSGRIDGITQGPLVVDLDSDDWDWHTTFTHGWANLGLDPRGAPDSWAHFEGSDVQSLAPVLEFEGCMP